MLLAKYITPHVNCRGNRFCYSSEADHPRNTKLSFSINDRVVRLGYNILIILIIFRTIIDPKFDRDLVSWPFHPEPVV